MGKQTKKYYIVEEEYEVTEREWDGHRGLTVRTGRYSTHYVIYEKTKEGKDNYYSSFQDKAAAEEWVAIASSKPKLIKIKNIFKRKNAAFHKTYNSLSKDLDKLSLKYKKLLEELEERTLAADECFRYSACSVESISAREVTELLSKILFHRRK